VTVGNAISRWSARALVVVAAASAVALAQPLPAIHDVYAVEDEADLGPAAPNDALARWSEVVREAKAVRYDFRLRIEPAGGAKTEASGRAELALDRGRTTDFRIVLADGGTTLVPEGSAATRQAERVDPDLGTSPHDRIARYAAFLPVPGSGDEAPVEIGPAVAHFARASDDEHVYLHFDANAPSPVRIERIADGPTRIVLELTGVSFD
jgi:hypothetical protein